MDCENAVTKCFTSGFHIPRVDEFRVTGQPASQSSVIHRRWMTNQRDRSRRATPFDQYNILKAVVGFHEAGTEEEGVADDGDRQSN